MTRKLKEQRGLAAVRAKVLDGLTDLEEARDLSDPDANLLRNGIKAGQWEGFPHDKMPPGCPITVLGMKGETVYVISATGFLYEVSRWDHPTLVKLFSPYVNYLKWAWPAFTKAKEDEEGNIIPPKVDRVARDKAVEAIIAEAGRRGTFDPSENVRGRGGWKSGDNFVWHSGKYLFSTDIKPGLPVKPDILRMRPGEHDGYFYAQDSDTMRPWQTPIDAGESPAHQILQDLKTWNWERGYIDPIFTLGWIIAAFLSGALEQRPIIFVTGGPGTGKSALQRYVRSLFENTIFATSNTTAAGIYQTMGHDSRPIAVDEFERKANATKETAIIEIARQAYSGDKGYRGGSDGASSQFELHNAFMFTAILKPHMEQQDKTRMAIMQLNPLKAHGERPVVQDYWGRQLLRQVMDGYHDFVARILPKWRQILSDDRLHFDSRAIDTYGTLLACAELAVGEQGMIDGGLMAKSAGSSELDIEVLKDTLEFATAAERANQTPKWQDVIERLLGCKLDAYKSGERLTVGGVIEALENKDRSDMDIVEARARLALLGLGVRDRPKDDPNNPCTGYALAVPMSDDNLNRLFGDSEFARGGWTDALQLGPEEIVPRGLAKAMKTVKINRAAKTCTLVDLQAYDEWVDRA
ncbi:hypothetical protein KGO5_01730 [Sinorhizobium sp. KGO-5]|uniref:hypothetical protein n=1 Tax=Sinorhizobium sp. KGO-5 TaxID=1470810 RepID=UPI00294A6DE4|nr:hypothetical protein KGO5_01730 [Sinorhizobium sp. KGO-5]